MFTGERGSAEADYRGSSLPESQLKQLLQTAARKTVGRHRKLSAFRYMSVF